MKKSQYPDYLGENHPERPLPNGSIVENSGMLAKVVDDDGSGPIMVDYDGTDEEWEWDAGGQSIIVLVVNDDNTDVSEMTPEEVVEMVELSSKNKKSSRKANDPKM